MTTLIYAFVRFANASANMKLFLLQKSKQNNFRFALVFTNLTKHVNNQTNCRITLEKNEENMDLSHIHLAVTSKRVGDFFFRLLWSFRKPELY